MIHLPDEILSLLVDYILLAEQYRAKHFTRDLCHLRLAARVFADSPVIKAVLFKTTYQCIGPYVRYVILEPSRFDSTLCKECYRDALLENRFKYRPETPQEEEFVDSFRTYHARALEDELVETELQLVWAQAFASFHHLRRVALGLSALSCGGRDADRSDPLSFHRLPMTMFQEIPAVDSTRRNTGNRLLKLMILLLRTPGLSATELSVEIEGDCETTSTSSSFSLKLLKHLNLSIGSFGSGWQCVEVSNGVFQKTTSREMVHRIDLLAGLLAAAQNSLEELILGHLKPRGPFWWNDQIFSADICCNQLRILHLSAFGITNTHLISAIKSRFPNLKQLIFSNYAMPMLEGGSVGWPVFFLMLKEISQRRLKVEGTIMTMKDENATADMLNGNQFSIRLGASYARQYQAFTSRTCSHQTAVSVAIRRYMDDIITWSQVVEVMVDYPKTLHFFGIGNEDDEDEQQRLED